MHSALALLPCLFGIVARFAARPVHESIEHHHARLLASLSRAAVRSSCWLAFSSGARKALSKNASELSRASRARKACKWQGQPLLRQCTVVYGCSATADVSGTKRQGKWLALLGNARICRVSLHVQLLLSLEVAVRQINGSNVHDWIGAQWVLAEVTCLMQVWPWVPASASR